MNTLHRTPARRSPLRADLSGRRVLITGGSRGIAGAIARSFCANGASVAVNFNADADALAGFPDAAAHLVHDISQSGGRAIGIEGDLTQENVAQRIADEAAARLGQVDVVVLSASVQVRKDFLAQTVEDIARQLQINLVSAVQLLQAVIPAMREAGWGRIITIGSVQEVAPSGEMPIYAMTKSGQENLVRNLAVQNAPFGITVNNIAPGLVETDRNAFRRRDPDVWTRISANANPIGRAGLPEDIVGPALFLASDASSFVTGSTLYATGGSHIPWSAQKNTFSAQQ